MLVSEVKMIGHIQDNEVITGSPSNLRGGQGALILLKNVLSRHHRPISDYFLHIALLLLMAVTTSCGGAYRYDSRLAAADSLMHDLPDSALAIVEAVPVADLAREGDRAYHDLLLTQARYRCYITATSDSDINRALDYFRRHDGEREKLTRAYIYKGAVMEELGHPDSAMLYYKHAEATADEKDYANLGQINTRIADLYRIYYGDQQICYDKYEQALKYYQYTKNKHLQMDCLFYMGGCSAITGTGNAEQLLTQAIQLAEELNDSSYYFNCQELRCRQLAQKDSTLRQAKQIGLHCLNHYRKYVNNDLILDLAYIYVQECKLDSARFYLNYVNENASTHLGQIRTRKYLTLSRIAHIEGDLRNSNHYNQLAHQVADSINNNKQKYQIQQIENTNNVINIESRKQTIDGLKWLVMSLIVASMAMLAAFLVYHYRKERRIKSIMHELQGTSVDNHEDLLEQIDAKDVVLQQFVKNMVTFMQTSINASEYDSPAVIRQRIKQEINHVADDEEFWRALRTYLDKNHNNVITKIAQNPEIKKKDLRFIELCCCGFNYVEISITMGYDPKYISQKRQEIAKKLKIDIPLMDYLNRIMLQD